MWYSRGNFSNFFNSKNFKTQLGYEINNTNGFASQEAGSFDGENIRPFNKTVLDLSTKPYPPAEEGQLITAIREDRMTHRNVGSAAIAIANVGSKADGAIVLANDYDVAAGMLIAREAGAIVSEQVYETSRGPLSLVVAATSAQTHDALVQKCAALG